MSAEKINCSCCGSQWPNWGPETTETMCVMCRNRGGLCMHNISSRIPEGGGLPVFHYSIPHRDATGAADPATCQWCLSRFLRVA